MHSAEIRTLADAFLRDRLETEYEQERYEVFVSLGFDEVHAFNLAKDKNALLHCAATLIEHGCPHALAYEILRD